MFANNAVFPVPSLAQGMMGPRSMGSAPSFSLIHQVRAVSVMIKSFTRAELRRLASRLQDLSAKVSRSSDDQFFHPAVVMPRDPLNRLTCRCCFNGLDMPQEVVVAAAIGLGVTVVTTSVGAVRTLGVVPTSLAWQQAHKCLTQVVLV